MKQLVYFVKSCWFSAVTFCPSSLAWHGFGVVEVVQGSVSCGHIFSRSIERRRTNDKGSEREKEEGLSEKEDNIDVGVSKCELNSRKKRENAC